jgi:hypothetical protein
MLAPWLCSILSACRRCHGLRYDALRLSLDVGSIDAESAA